MSHDRHCHEHPPIPRPPDVWTTPEPPRPSPLWAIAAWLGILAAIIFCALWLRAEGIIS